MQSPGQRPQDRGICGANSSAPVAMWFAYSWSGPQRVLRIDFDSYLVSLIDSLVHGWEEVPPKVFITPCTHSLKTCRGSHKMKLNTDFNCEINFRSALYTCLLELKTHNYLLFFLSHGLTILFLYCFSIISSSSHLQLDLIKTRIQLFC